MPTCRSTGHPAAFGQGRGAPVNSTFGHARKETAIENILVIRVT